MFMGGSVFIVLEFNYVCQKFLLALYFYITHRQSSVKIIFDNVTPYFISQ